MTNSHSESPLTCLFVSDEKLSEHHNALKLFQTKPLCECFLERNELSINLGKFSDKFQKSMQESFCFSFSKLLQMIKVRVNQ